MRVFAVAWCSMDRFCTTCYGNNLTQHDGVLICEDCGAQLQVSDPTAGTPRQPTPRAAVHAAQPHAQP